MIAVRPISNDKAASSVVIAFLMLEKILIIFPPSGTATNVEPAVEFSVIFELKK